MMGLFLLDAFRQEKKKKKGFNFPERVSVLERKRRSVSS